MADSPHQCAAGCPADESERSSEVYEDIGQERLDQHAISALIRFFKLLDEWDREAYRS